MASKTLDINDSLLSSKTNESNTQKLRFDRQKLKPFGLVHTFGRQSEVVKFFLEHRQLTFLLVVLFYDLV